MIEYTVTEAKINTASKIFYSDLNISNSEIQSFISFANKTGDHQNRKTNVKADMSEWSIWTKTSIYDSVLEAVSDMVNNTTTDWLMKDYNGGVYKIKNVWLATYRKGDYTKAHTHGPESWASFVFFIKNDDNNTPLIFKGLQDYLFEPVVGRVVIFPSYLEHYVPVIESDSERIVLAGNIVYVPSNKE